MMLIECHCDINGNKASVIDEMTKEEYGVNLEANIEGLLNRMKDKHTSLNLLEEFTYQNRDR